MPDLRPAPVDVRRALTFDARMKRVLVITGLLAASAFVAVGCRATVYENSPPPGSAPPAATVSGDGTEETPGEAEAGEEPPAPQAEVIVYEKRPAPHYVWIGGHWAWHGKWVWVGGHWHAGRPHHVWVPGHWARVGPHRHRWVPGHWRR